MKYTFLICLQTKPRTGDPDTGRLEEPWLWGWGGAGAWHRGERDNAWNPRSQTPSGRQEEERTVTADGTVGPCEAEEHSCCLMWVERGEDYSRGGEREESGVEMRAEYRWELGTDHPNRGSVSSIARRSHTHTTTSNTTRL